MKAFRISVCVLQRDMDDVRALAGGTFRKIRQRTGAEGVLVDCSYIVAAANEKEAMFVAEERNWSVTGVAEVVRHWWQREVVGKDYKLSFLRSLSFYCASMSAAQALITVIQAESHPGIRHELDAAVRVLESGGLFSDALAQISFFNETVIAILVAGEKTGAMKQAIASAVEHYEHANKTRAIMLGILSLMSWDLGIVISSAVSVQTTFLPWLEGQAAEAKDKAAFLKQLELGYWLNGVALLAAVIICAIVLAALYQGLTAPGAPGKAKIEGLMRRTPILSSFFLNQEMSDTFAIAAVMLAGGVGLDKTVAVAEKAAKTLALKRYWSGVTRRIDRGDSILGSVGTDDLIRDGERQMIAAHQNSKQLGVILGKISEARGLEAERNARQVRNAIVYGTIGYGAYSALIFMWLLMAQNSVITGVTDVVRGH